MIKNPKITIKAFNNFLIDELGEDLPPLVRILKDKKNVSEFKLAERLNITVNQIRNMLYRLHQHDLIRFTRKKDKRKGWYIYYWTLDAEKLESAYLSYKERKLEDYKQRLEREEEGVFFVCPNGCLRLKYENAMEYDFKCRECGELMVQQDNRKTIANIREQVQKMEKELKDIIPKSPALKQPSVKQISARKKIKPKTKQRFQKKTAKKMKRQKKK